MKKKEFLIQNKEMLKGLKEISKFFGKKITYFVTGSTTLLSYTQNFYLRNINDIDVVANIGSFDEIKEYFRKKGYSVKEFRDVGPLLLKIAKGLSTNDYLRLTKKNCVIDIVGAKFNNDRSVDIAFLPFLYLHINSKATRCIKRGLFGIEFHTTPIESLYCLNQFYKNTVGSIGGMEKSHRGKEREIVKKLSSKKVIKNMLQDSYIKLFGMKVPVQKWIKY